MELEQALKKLESDSSCACILLQTEGDTVFSAGADLDVYRDGTESEVADYLYSLGALLSSILYLGKPLVLKVQGKAIGGALGLLAAADYVIASEQATYRLPELELGLAPSVIAPFLLHKIGNGFFRTLSFSGEYFDSTWAYSSGLISESVTMNTLDHRIEIVTEKLSRRDPSPVLEYKKSLAMDVADLQIKIKQNSILNARNIVKAKEKGLFAKKS